MTKRARKVTEVSREFVTDQNADGYCLPGFFDFMLEVAGGRDESTVFTNGHKGVQVQVSRDIKFFDCGRMGVVPSEWSLIYDQFLITQNNPSFKQYISLGKELRAEITEVNEITKSWVDGYTSSNLPEPSTKPSKRTKRTTGST